MTGHEVFLVVVALCGAAFLRGFIGEAVRDLRAARRRRRQPVEEVTAADLDALLDSDRAWLEAHGWQPPPRSTPARALGNVFTLTVAEHQEYVRHVREAQQIRELLDLEEEHQGRRVPELRAALAAKADQIRAASESWEASR